MVGADKERLNYPVTLPAGTEIPLRLQLHTDNVLGSLRHKATFVLSQMDSTPIEAIELPLVAEVIIPLLAIQETFYAEFDIRQKAPVRCSALLVSAGAVQDVAITRVTASAPERVKCEVVPVWGEVAVGPFKTRKRYELKVEYMPDPNHDDFSETVSVVTEDARLKPLTIRVWGKVRRGFEFSSKEIVFLPRPAGQPFTYEVEFRWSDPEDCNLAIDQLPQGIDCQIKAVGNDRKVLTFTMKPAETIGPLKTEARVRAGRDQQLVRFPVTAYGALR
jgi:hypothetical protein